MWKPERLPLDGGCVVACSGGADSVALAHWLAGGGAGGADLYLVYVDHGLQPESRRMEEQVAALAASLRIPHRCMRVSVDPEGASLEARARHARYQALEAAADDFGLRWIAVGHTASDQAETVLMRILRGTGLRGLAAMAPVSGRRVRPLLSGCDRAGARAYCQEHNLVAVEDPMNEDPRYTRVRIRHSVLPLLEKENPEIERALCRLAQSARDQRAFAEAEAVALFGSEGALSVDSLRSASPAAVAEALHRRADGAGVGPLEDRHLRAITALYARPAGGSVSIDLPGGRAVREYDELRLEAAGANGACATGTLGVRGPRPPYRIRRWRAGDRMRPERLKGRQKKVSELFVDAKVPSRLRRGARVVERESDGELVWVEHLGRAFGTAVEVEEIDGNTLTPNRK